MNEVNSAAKSKINWTNLVSLAAVGLTFLGLDLSPEVQTKVVETLAVGTPVVTIIWRTWFTKK